MTSPNFYFSKPGSTEGFSSGYGPPTPPPPTLRSLLVEAAMVENLEDLEVANLTMSNSVWSVNINITRLAPSSDDGD